MKIWKKILKLATVGVAVFALAACGNKTEEKTEAQAPAQETAVAKARTVQEIKDSGVIRIGVFTDKAPLVTLMKMEKIKVMMFTSQIV